METHISNPLCQHQRLGKLREERTRRDTEFTDLNIHTFMAPEQRNWDKQLMEQIIRHRRDQEVKIRCFLFYHQ